MAKGSRVQDFDRLGVDQLMSMFSDNAPSDHDSVHEEKIDGGSAQAAPDPHSQEEQSRCKIEPPEASGMQQVLAAEYAVDPKRIKRILANRQSAQRSRVRKLQYISELEQSVMSLQTEVADLSPRVAFLDHQRSLLILGNTALRQRIAALAQDKIFKDAHQEVLKKEIERLRQAYSQKDLKKMPSAVGPPPSPHHKVEKLLS
ncbi:unnamed protein product [Spirodela intermedia]|uniref:BZIP domain-containing protein n=1 Tax=Spirodela intermedia TaxID=51605 RepID=A0A7I8ITE6_SPIIN|nr:unnamed protein product [Spirodela intermedia]CAA6661076.1 unnamed protein product [Spirodela intermedia]